MANLLRHQLDALERIQQHRQQILRRHTGQPLELKPSTLVNQLREERDEELFADPRSIRD